MCVSVYDPSSLLSITSCTAATYICHGFLSFFQQLDHTAAPVDISVQSPISCAFPLSFFVLFSGSNFLTATCYFMALAQDQSFEFYSCISLSTRDVTQSTSVDVHSSALSMSYLLPVCFPISSAYCSNLSRRSILSFLWHTLWKGAKLCLKLVHQLCSHELTAFLVTKHLHNIYHLLQAAIYARYRSRNAVLLASLKLQRGLLLRHEFAQRLCMLINKVVCSKPYFLYSCIVTILYCAYSFILIIAKLHLREKSPSRRLRLNIFRLTRRSSLIIGTGKTNE
jgi:hypothetical protein